MGTSSMRAFSGAFVAGLVSTMVLLACASSEPAKGAPAGGAAPSSGSEPAPGATTEEPAGGVAESFDLVVRATDLSDYWATFGEQEVEMIVAVRDAQSMRPADFNPQKSPLLGSSVFISRWRSRAR
jgi:hypothetical protein